MINELVDIDEKYRAILEALDAVGIGIDIIDRNYNVVFQNNILKERFGDSTGKNCYENYMKSNGPCDFCKIRTVMETNQVENIELTGADGRIYNLISAPLKNPDGKVDKVAEIILDITDQKESENQIKISEVKFRNLFEKSSNAIALTDSSGKITDVNFALEKLFGYSAEELINQNYMELPIYPEKTISTVIGRFNDLIKKGYLEPYEYKIIKKDKSTAIIKSTVSHINIGEQDYFQIIIEDITEKKNAEEKLRESEEKFRQLFEENLNGIILVDMVGHIINWNSSIEKNFGYSLENYIGKNIVEFPGISPKFIHKIKKRLEKYFVGEKLDPIRVKVYKKDGTPAWVNAQASLVDVGNEKNLQIIIEDITDIVHVHQKLKESEEKFRNIAEQSQIGIVILQDNLIKYCNQRMADLFGYSVQEILNFKQGEFSKLFAPDSLEMVMDQASKKQLNEPGQIHHYTIHGVKKSGNLFWLDNISKSIIFEGRPADLVTQIDITNRKKAEQKILESEEKYRTLFEGANDAIFLIKDYKFFECNSKTLEVFGFSTESDIIGLFPWEISPISQPDGRDSKQAAIGYMNEALNGKSQRFYWKHLKKDGIPIDAEVSLNCIILENKNFLQAIVRDISEKLKAEQALMESEAKFRNLSDQSLMGILIAQDNKIKYVNRAYADIFGYSIEEMMKWELKDLMNAIHKDDKDFTLQQLAKKQKGDSKDIMTHYSYRGIKKSGEIIWIDNFSKTILYEGRPADFVVQTDITNKIKSEKIIKESEEKYRTLFEGANDAIFLIKDNKILECNTKTLEIFGANKEINIIGLSPWNLSPSSQPDGGDSKQLAIKYLNEISKGKSQRFYWKHQKLDGTLIDTEVSLNPIKIEDRNFFQAVVRDITEQKEAERLIIEENKKLQELNQIRQELMTRISHELKTPITSMYGASQALLEIHRKDMSKRILELVEIMQRGSIRLKSLVENLLDISRIDSKVFKLKVERENISELIRECINDLRYIANERDIKINVDLPDESIIKIDKIRIGQVVTNIVSNAINNTPPTGRIFITIAESNEFLDILIKDTGVGITEVEKSRLFQKFGKIERFGKGHDVHIEGSGLGLYISKEFVELHGGKIFIESEGRNKGAIFTVRLYRK